MSTYLISNVRGPISSSSMVSKLKKAAGNQFRLDTLTTGLGIVFAPRIRWMAMSRFLAQRVLCWNHSILKRRHLCQQFWSSFSFCCSSAHYRAGPIAQGGVIIRAGAWGWFCWSWSYCFSWGGYKRR